MSKNWDFYFSNVNGALASLFVDLGLHADAPDPKRPNLLWVWVQFKSPRPDGLSSSEEAPSLSVIEDALVKALQRPLDAQYVGRITTSGRREFYWYARSDRDLDRVVHQVMAAFAGYTFQTGHQADKDWSQYLDLLYPAPEQMQSIENRKVVQALKERGDNLTAPRPVRHWVYFEAEAARDQYAQKAAGLGYTIVKAGRGDDGQHERPFSLTIERVDKVDWQSIDVVVLELFRLADELGGDYDGWETSLEK